MASVILPTVRRTSAMDSIVAGLRDTDELFIVCDSEDDPIWTAAPPEAEVIVAGDPVGCSGKAHALATGMERATSEIIVWSDDDVDRDDDGEWLERLVEHARRDGAATEVPVFVGDGFWPLLEPVFVLTVTYDVLSGSHVWGGGVAFDRNVMDEEQFLRKLRSTVGDDYLLSEYLDDPWIDRGHIRRVEVSGTLREIYHRVVRWIKPGYVYHPLAFTAGIGVFLALALGAVVFPLAGISITTLVGFWTYRAAKIRRPSVFLSYPSFILLPILLVLGAVAPTFRWGNREYRWQGKFDVTVYS
ncbi:glycosyltransferase [Halosolutus gelatinilyticus]|uniref:glycosyltransferase n=1 Tax=Halosolutus gelatinilyticus TaxID=2931975 RepID=UPI001FF375CB|nr:glycosyltransferase [Halosolutus gelatinilyticus]